MAIITLALGIGANTAVFTLTKIPQRSPRSLATTFTVLLCSEFEVRTQFLFKLMIELVPDQKCLATT